MDPQRFSELADHVASLVPAGFGHTLHASGEHTDFARFNGARVRQSGSVSQADVAIRLVQGQRHATATVTLSAEPDEDRRRARALVDQLAQLVPDLPEDPHLLLADEVRSTSQIDAVATPAPEEVIEVVRTAADGADLVGIYAGGDLWEAFANHHGQRNWFQSGGTLLDYSLVHSTDRAVKSSVGGKGWDASAVARSIADSRAQLEPLARPSRTVPPGAYRAYLAPAAVSEITDLMEWAGFSTQGHRTKMSPLLRLSTGQRTLSDQISIAEDTAGGIGPNFQSEGFVKPATVPLITEGRHVGSLTSPRSAAEYGLAPNGAGAWERPNALAMAGGDLEAEAILERLGTGVWVSNLWYLNYSDRSAARMTGMTRFATFWVEDGQIVAPLSVMRFDVSLFDLFGPNLEALTREVAFLPSASTYGARSTSSTRVPGALVSALPFTL